MTIEQNLKSVIGEQAFTICALQAQIEQLNQKIAELEKPKGKTK